LFIFLFWLWPSCCSQCNFWHWLLLLVFMFIHL
jgi:hypothetical protein